MPSAPTRTARDVTRAGDGGPAQQGPARPAVVAPVPLGRIAARAGVATRDGDVMITGATLRAHEARPGDLFAALPGSRTHGADHAAVALERGAAAVLTDADGAARPALRDTAVPVLTAGDPRAALGPASTCVYGDPSTRLAVLGVTGTSGKTTTVTLLEAALAEAGAVTGLVGTVETRVAGRTLPSAFTTPEAPDLQALFALMVEKGVTHAAMEVSSHALALERVGGTRFAVGAFTNLSQDHLDFHPDMESYFAAKARLFDGRADAEVVCVEQEWGRRLVTPDTITVGAGDAVWRAEGVTVQPGGAQAFRAIGPGVDLPVTLRLPGAYNVTNALVALACGVAAGFDAAPLAAGLGRVEVPGRMQRVDAGQPFLAVVDYAHKPAAVAALLETLRAQTPDGRVLTVLGCGGDRDREKRPVMGRLAAERSDALWVTDDNPRTEDPAAIRAAVLDGARAVPGAEVHEVGDRRAAIRDAVAVARPGDVVVVAGKGHETGQQVGVGTLPFSDVEELTSALEQRG